MPLISVQPETIRRIGDSIKLRKKKVYGTSNHMSGSGIDSLILARRSIGSRLDSARRKAEEIENRLSKLSDFILSSAGKYEYAEKSVLWDVRVLTGLPWKRRVVNDYAHHLSNSGAFPTSRGVLEIALDAAIAALPLQIRNDLKFIIEKRNGISYIKISEQLLGRLNRTGVYNLLNDALGGTGRWDSRTINKLINKGLPLYDEVRDKIFRTNINKFNLSPDGTLYEFLDRKYGNGTVNMWNKMGKAAADEFKFWEDFKGYKNATTLTKFAKGAGAVGTVLTIGETTIESFYDSNTGKWDFSNGHSWQEFGVSTGVDLAGMAAAAAAGATVTSWILPPAGPIVGGVVGIGVHVLINSKFGDPPQSVIDYTKAGVNYVIDNVDDGVKWAIDKGEDLINEGKKKVSNAVDEVTDFLGDLVW